MTTGTTHDNKADTIVVGGGIVGLACAYELTKRYTGSRVVVLEKEDSLSKHQTGHNSGVIHSGIYYKPGSLKAINCRRGKELLEAFCEEHSVAWEKCGKVIVALDDVERGRLASIYERGQANGVECRMIEQAELNELEPHCAGIEAIHVPETGIVDYVGMGATLGELIKAAGGDVFTSNEVTGIKEDSEGVEVTTIAGVYRASNVINCAGLHSDRVTAMSGRTPSVKIVPFRGEYYELKQSAQHLCKNLIYPVPDPAFPFLGVHFTRMVNGGIECGPNAVLAFAREGYTKTTVNWRDLAETLSYPAFWKVSLKYWRTGLGEIHRSFSKAAFVKALQRLMPELTGDDLVAIPAGVRAQALAPDGTLLDDFAIDASGRIVNVINAPSPAATSALSIGITVVDELEKLNS